MQSTRRKFLGLAGLAPLVTIAGTRAMAAETTCYDPAALSLQQRNRRRSIAFVELSPDPVKRCGACAFFKPGQGDCGACDMLGGGPVTARGYCPSFARKP
jgi:High potential iron-sulfur protein